VYRLLAFVAAACAAAAALLVGGNDGSEPARTCPIPPARTAPPGFEDVTKQAGLDGPLRGMFAHAVSCA
jgi:hypothetical protein